MSEFQIVKDNTSESRVIKNDLTNEILQSGEVLVKVDTFALSANNVTYAVVGE